jgi:hypothetical protein
MGTALLERGNRNGASVGKEKAPGIFLTVNLGTIEQRFMVERTRTGVTSCPCAASASFEEVGSRTFGDYSGSEDCSKLECTVIEQAKASEHGGNREDVEGIGGGVGAMIEGQTILAEEIQR